MTKKIKFLMKVLQYILLSVTFSEASRKCEFKTVSSSWKTEKREGKGFRNFTQDSSGLGLTCQ